LRECVLHGVGNKEEFSTPRFEHAFGDAVIEEDEELIVKAINIEQKDGLGVDL
jgi:hypothetical protein